MIQIAGNIQLPGWSGIIDAEQNSLTLKATPSGNIIVSQDNNLIPEVDGGQQLGLPFLRWGATLSDRLETDEIFSPSNSNVTLSGHLVPASFLEHQVGLRLNPFAGVNAFSGFFAQVETQTLTTVDSAQPLVVLVDVLPLSNEAQGFGDISTPRGWCHIVATDHYAENLIPYNGDTGAVGGDNAMALSGFLVAISDNAGGIGTGDRTFKWGFFQNLILGGSSGILGASDQAAGIATSGNIMPLENLLYGLGDRSTPRTFSHVVTKENYVENLIPYRASDGAAGNDRLLSLSGFMVPHVNNGGGIGTPAQRFQIVAARQLNIAALPFGGHIDANGDPIPFSGGIVPTEDNVYSVGAVGNRWCDIRACSGVFDSVLLTDGSPLVTSGVQVLYVAKHGNDSFEGVSPVRPFETFARAAEVASGLNPAFDNRICIRGIDGGSYDDVITILPYVDILAECAELRGHVTTFENNTVHFGKIWSDRDFSASPTAAGSAISKYDNGGSGTVTVRANELEVRGPGSAGLPIVGGVQNASLSGTMYINIDRVTTVSGVSILAAGGRTSLDVGDMVGGDDTVSVNIGSIFTEAVCNGTVRSISQGGLSPAIALNTDGCSGNLSVQSITRLSPNSTAWRVAGDNSSLKLFVNDLEGNEQDTGLNNEICVVKACDVSTALTNNLPVDARAVSGNIIPDTASAYHLGDNSNPFSAALADRVETDELVSPSDGVITVSGHLVPALTNLYNLGANNPRWNQIHFVSGFFTQQIQGPGLVAVSTGGTVTIDPTTALFISTNTLIDGTVQWANGSDVFEFLGSGVAFYGGRPVINIGPNVGAGSPVSPAATMADLTELSGIIPGGGGGSDPARQNILYVGKHGDDSFDGLHPDRPFLTIAAAKAAADTLGPTSSSGVTIRCVDAGVYGESFQIPPFVTLDAPMATVSGTIDVGDESTVHLRELRVVGSGEPSFGIIRRNGVGTPATVSGVSNVRIDQIFAQSELVSNMFPIVAGTSGALNIEVNTAICTSGYLISANGGGQVHYRGNEAQVGSAAGLSDGFAVMQDNSAVIANVNRIRGDKNEKLLAIGGDNCSGFITAGEIDVSQLLFGLGFTNADVRIFANAIKTRVASFEVGTYNHRCVVDSCDIATVTSNFGRPVDARAVSGSIIPDASFTHSIGIGEDVPGGGSSNPFAQIAAQSGVFNEIRPVASGGEILTGAHWLPSEDDTYLLGSPSRNWSQLYAFSGIFGGPVEIGDNLVVTNGITAGGNIGGLTMTASVTAFTVNFATSLLSLTRPEFSTTTAINTGSGLGLRNENRWYDHLRTNTEAASVETLTMSMDGMLTRPYGVPIADANSVVLHDHFALITLSQTTSPSEWQVLVRRTQSDGTREGSDEGLVASGWFGWNASADSIQKTFGRWETSGNVPVEFEPGSCYDVVIHNDGSGTALSAPAARLSLGFRINANGPNLGRGE